MFSIIDREAMEREGAELKAALAAQEAEKKAAIPFVPCSRVMPPAPPSSRWDGTDTLRTPITDTVASEPAPKESKSLQSWFFTEEAETDRFAEPEPPPSAKSESFFSGWTIFETLFSSRTNTEDKATTTTGFFSGPIPRRTGWLFIDMFLSEKTATAARQPSFSFLTKFLLLAVPLIAFAGYYQYASVSGATILGKTLSNSVNLERGLVGHWTFDGGDMTATTALDVSGNSNTGTLTNGPKRVIGKLGQGLLFNGDQGGDGTLLNAGSGSVIDNMDLVTISFWIKSDMQGTIIRKAGEVGTSPWTLSHSSGNTLRWERNGGRWSSPNNTLLQASNQWKHVVVIHDRTSVSNDPVMYVNGISVSITENLIPSYTNGDDSDGDLYLGNRGSLGVALGGTLDDVRIYNRILTAKEIERLYKMGEGVKINTNTIPAGSTLEDGLVGYWSFNGQDMNGNSAFDRSGNNSTGTLTNGPTKVPGKTGQGVQLNGSNHYITAGDINAVDSVSELTACAWVWHDTITTDDALVSKEDVSSANGFVLFRDDVGFTSARPDMYSFVVFDSADTDTTRIETAANSARQNTWTHVCGTYRANNADGLRLYVDSVGTNDNPVSTMGINAISGGTQPFVVGARSDLSMPYSGKIDEVRIYNRALSADEVAQLYRSGSGVTINAAPQGGGGEPAFTCGVSTVEDADANVYDTIEIGTQCWMQQNMRVGTRINVATNQTNNSTIEKWCYSDTDSNCTSDNPNQPDGGLYQWDEAMQYSTTPGAQGICPSGWHIPTHDELTTLERAVCTSGSCVTDFPYDTTTTGYRGTTESTKLKPNGSSGFEGNLSGAAYSNSFNNRGLVGYLWSSSESGGNAWFRYFVSFFAQVYRASDSKTLGHSVRCLKD